METIRTIYQGQYRTLATHVQSANQLITDAPTDNNGKGEAFSPTDLVATALASCMLTLMDITANKYNFSLGEVTVKTTKEMASSPRRISRLLVEFDLSKTTYTPDQKKILERAALNCPVALSIHPDIEMKTTFNY